MTMIAPDAALYERVSTLKRESTSVEEQHAENLDACGANGWIAAASYGQDDRSASRFRVKDRKGWEQLTADLRSGRFRVLVVWEFSRASRELEESAALLTACRDQGVLIHVTSHGRTYDMRNPHDWKTLAEGAVDAAYESEKTSQRVSRNLRHSAQKGRPHARIPYGYRSVYDQHSRRLVNREPQQPEASIVVEIIERVAGGYPIVAICRDLNDRGVPSPGEKLWQQYTVRNMASNLAYIGKRMVNGEEVDGIWPPITDDPGFVVTFRASRALILSRVRKPGEKQTRPGRARWLASYIATCGVCGGVLHAAPARTRIINGRPRYLREMYGCRAAGSHVAVLTGSLDQLLERLVIGRLSRPDIYDVLVSGDDEAVLAARAEAARLRAELDEWAAADISARAYQIREARLQPKIEAAERRATELAVPATLRGLAEPGADVAARWADLPIAARRDVVRALFEEIALIPAARKGRRPERLVPGEHVRIEWRRKLPGE